MSCTVWLGDAGLRLVGNHDPVSVPYSTRGITAQPGIDYTDVHGTLTFTGVTTTQSFTIPILNRTGNQDRTVNLSLGVPIGANPGAFMNAVLTIFDTTPIAPSPVVYFEKPADYVSETAQTATAWIDLQGAISAPVTVTWSAYPQTAQLGVNYYYAPGIPSPHTVTFTPGITRLPVSVGLIRDYVVTGNLTFNFTIDGVSGPALSSFPNPCTMTIVDADAYVAPVNLTIAGGPFGDLNGFSGRVNESAGYIDIPVTLDRTPQTTVQVNLDTHSGTRSRM